MDTHLQAGTTVPPHYDSLLAKVIGHGTDRDHALALLRDALSRCTVEGVTTNLPLHQALLADPEFAAGGVDTGYLARWLARATSRAPGPDAHPATTQARESAHQPQEGAPDRHQGAAGNEPGSAQDRTVRDDHG